MNDYPLWHFGVPLSLASQFVGVLDMVLGAFGTVIVAIDAGYNLHQYDGDYRHRLISLRLAPWVSVLLISAFWTQVIVGVALYHGAGAKKRNLIQLWMLVTPLIFVAIPIRVYELMIVLEFYRELEEEEKDKQITEKPSSPPQNPQGGAEPPPPYLQHDGNYPKLGLIETKINSGGGGGVGMGVTGQYQPFHQQPTIVSTVGPATNQKQVLGGTGQQQQPWWSSETSASTPSAPPPTVQRPSLEGFQDGLAGQINNG